MAQNVLEMVIAAEDRFSDTFGRFDTKLNSMHTKADRLAGPLANATTALVAFAGGVAAAGIALDVMALDKAVKAETALANLRKVFDGSEAGLKSLAATAEEFAVKYGTSFENATAGMTAWAAEGKNVQEIQTGLLAAQRLAIAGNIQEGDAADRLSSIMAALGGKFEYVHHVVDATNAVANAFATSENNITLGIKEFIGVGAQQNLTLDQMIGLFTGVDVVQKNAGESGNALKTILVRLHEESRDSVKAWDMLGLSHKKANGEFVNSYDLLKQMADRWPTLTQEQQQFISTTFSGLYHVSKFNLVMRNMETVTKATETALHSEGSAIKEVETRLNTTEHAVKRATESFNIMLKHIGEQQTPALNGVAKAFAEVIQKIDRWNTETQAAGSVFNEFLKPAIDSFIAALDTLGNHFPEIMAKVDFGALKQNLKEFSAALGDMLGVDFSTVDGWAAAIQKAADTAAALIKTLQGVTTVLGGFLEVGGKALDWFNNLDAGTQKSIGYVGALALAFTALSAPIGAAIVVIGGLAGSYSALTLASTGAAAAETAAGAAAGGAAAATGGLITATGILTAALGTAGLLGALYLVVEGYRTYAQVRDVNAESEKNAAAALDAVNQKYGTNFKTVEDATRALADHNSRLISLPDAQRPVTAAITGMTGALESMTRTLQAGTDETVNWISHQHYAMTAGGEWVQTLNGQAAVAKKLDDALEKLNVRYTVTKRFTEDGTLVTTFEDKAFDHLSNTAGRLAGTLYDVGVATTGTSGKIKEAGGELDTLQKKMDLKLNADTSQLDLIKEAFKLAGKSVGDMTYNEMKLMDAVTDALAKGSGDLQATASAIGSASAGSGGIAGQVLVTEQARLALLRELQVSERQLTVGMQTFTASFNGAQDKLTSAVEKSAQKFDALINALGQQKQYSVDVTVQNADGAIRDLTQRVLEELIVRIKQENLLAITTG